MPPCQHYAPDAGSPLQPYMPYNLFGTGTCRVEGIATYLTCPSTTGTGSTPPEQFTPIRPDLGAVPIKAGDPVIWQSTQTGKFCRVVAVSGQNRVQCDMDSLAQATALTYTGSGVWCICWRGGSNAVCLNRCGRCTQSDRGRSVNRNDDSNGWC